MDNKLLKSKGIALCCILRHTAIKRGIKIDAGGWVKLNDILSKCDDFKETSFEDIEYIVRENNKKRFTLSEISGEWFIKANQGHSIKYVKDDLLLTEITDPEYLPIAVHSTYKESISIILKEGLSKMKRNHIHMAKSKNIVHGTRKNATAFINIDVKRAIEDGIKFYESDNGVILSAGVNGIIDSKYFLSIEYK